MTDIRKKIIISGIVQGVGFRPFVYKTALAAGVSGFIKNTSSGVEIEAQGSKEQLADFLQTIKTSAPASARPGKTTAREIKIKKEKGFMISGSLESGKQTALIPPDLALCEACAKEISSDKERRYAYALTNCTACGPRYTITKELPYDRKKTTMASFKMCSACAGEYENPSSRRFHAEPNACPVCGPKVVFVYGKTRALNEFALQAAADVLKKGKIAAIKSIGGFHLACDAKNAQAVRLLRKKKNRPHKPLALMMPSLKAVKEYCFVNKKEEELLKSAAAPLVLLRRKKELPGVADNLNTYAVMLPFTPMHKIIFDMLGPAAGPLVMTSANLTREPLIADNDEAVRKMKGIADAFLLHNRDIYNKIDDSIVMECNGKIHVVRNARGLVPGAVKLPFSVKTPVLAAGAEKTGAFCLFDGDKAYLSQYLGDQDIKENNKFYLDVLEKTKKLLKIKPRLFARDLHPDYFTSLLFKKALPVQHHAAHALAGAAEHGVKEPFLGIIFDGSGLGTDGRVWGGEFLVFNKKSWRRAAHFKYIPMIGGDEAVKQIWRLAFSALSAVYGAEPPAKARALFKDIKHDELRLAGEMLAKKINCPEVSSLGRLFDAAACLAGLRNATTYQAQAAMELEALYDHALAKNKKNPFKIILEEAGGKIILNPLPMFKEMVSGSLTRGQKATFFHDAVIEAAVAAAKKTGLKTVVLGGGCFQNKILLSGITKGLEKAGFKVYSAERAPLGDGGLALGQGAALISGIKGPEAP